MDISGFIYQLSLSADFETASTTSLASLSVMAGKRGSEDYPVGYVFGLGRLPLPRPVASMKHVKRCIA
jgi:hypothetical protein